MPPSGNSSSTNKHRPKSGHDHSHSNSSDEVHHLGPAVPVTTTPPAPPVIDVDAHHSDVQSSPYLINLSEDDDDDDIKLLEIRNDTNDLLNNTHPLVTKKLSDVQCPICFDDITKATATSCGHIFCLECIQKSVASSNARGQTRGKRGVGLCPLCRKRVVFKDTVVMRMKVRMKQVKPPPV
ncbi:hypothetical protein PSN45_003928 [Yamadazyma tenuis]|uniref:RING-type domain-containing protein n=1 Tax=Candida tenuis (strain ATCC 10573 / BCRC 21748 / CBS 615 / JCM 9827 / NBRC 10315 / NRRL Y-1498 / VKM Y-70) TaxID=590646 RepID=G3B4N7_CANTC|nr:uncharacterized protein CANTEDRAFT_105449 [Yamadazyma tenuis ATCC 10573]EGV63993.1 hypothetical protein CANTEDRAFT_105449 [Yamadazyma tenuis ATCC 10573]WEJ96389.1 hypothetical protein PSN45_003928 [Yamadazyma tenuis]